MLAKTSKHCPCTGDHRPSTILNPAVMHYRDTSRNSLPQSLGRSKETALDSGGFASSKQVGQESWNRAMDSTVTVGGKVTHPKFGLGEIQDLRADGKEARIRFGGFALWLPSTSLNILSVVDAVAEPVAEPQTTKELGPADIIRKKVVEGMRLGIVPDCGLKDWTVGRPEVLDRVSRWLAGAGQGTLIVEGAYGSGKTHLLRYMETLALDDGFAVSQVRVDPAEENSSFPLRLYASVVRSLRIPGTAGTRLELRDVLRRTVAHGSKCLSTHPFLGPMLERLRTGADREEDWYALPGDRRVAGAVPTHLDFTTVANLACNLITAISCLLVEDGWTKGVLLLIDEVETAEVRRYSYHWERTLNFLRGLSMACNDDPALDETVAPDVNGVRRGGRTGLVYSGHYPGIKYVFRVPTHLRMVLALTECKVAGRLKEWKAEQPLVQLREIDGRSLETLFDRVARAYESLYGVSLPSKTQTWALERLLLQAHSAGSVRGFVKAGVELLDFVRHHPDEPVEVLDAYRQF
jgi:hypothetical protein